MTDTPATLLDRLRRPGDPAAWTQFVKLSDSLLVEQVPHRIFPADLRTDLPDQKLTDFVRVVVWKSIDI